jgi:hypothetical protein
MVLPLGLVAILAGIVLFVVFLFRLGNTLLHNYLTHADIPLSFTVSQINFEWFYVPLSVLSLLALVSMAGIALFIVIGKRISNTPGKLIPGILAFVFIYRFIAFMWLIRSLRDVLLGAKRPWR